MDISELADELKRRRKAFGISQADMALLLKTGQPWVSRVENAKFGPRSVSMLLRYGAVLGFTVELKDLPADADGEDGPIDWSVRSGVSEPAPAQTEDDA